MATGDQQASTTWSTWQVYVIGLCAVLVGGVTGYLLRTSLPTAGPGAQQLVQQAEPAPSAKSGANPHSPEQMKALLEKRAAPMLEQLKKDPNDSATLVELGNLYYDTRQIKDAVQYYERAVKLQPANPRLRTDLGNAYYYLGDTTAAEQQFEAALKADPKFADALFNIGMIKWQTENDPKGAIAMWQKLLATNPNHPHRDQVEQMIARAQKHVNMKPGAQPAALNR